MNLDEYSKWYANLPQELRNEFCRIVIAKHGEKNPFTMMKEIESALKNWTKKNSDDVILDPCSTSEKLKSPPLQKKNNGKRERIIIASISAAIIALTSQLLPPEVVADLWNLIILDTTERGLPLD